MILTAPPSTATSLPTLVAGADQELATGFELALASSFPAAGEAVGRGLDYLARASQQVMPPSSPGMARLGAFLASATSLSKEAVSAIQARDSVLAGANLLLARNATKNALVLLA